MVILKDNDCTKDFVYFIEVTTPFHLSYLMEKHQKNYVPTMCPYIVVRELTKKIIEEAIHTLVNEKPEAYWLKLYHVANFLDINDLEKTLKRLKSE